VISFTLDSIISQISSKIEIVVVDGASSDSTREVVESYARDCHSLRYFREQKNSGVDADYDRAVSYARGKYCWLMTDDDIMLPGALDRILCELRASPDLVIVDAEVRTSDFARMLQKSRMHLTSDLKFDSSDDEFLIRTGDALSYIASVVIRRDIWLKRNRERYFGSLFVHAGVILQGPKLENIIVLAKPLIAIRYGVAMWTPRTFEIWMFKWPNLIWSSALHSEHAKRRVCSRQPWESPIQLLKHRARGSYTIVEYERYLKHRTSKLIGIVSLFIALFPAGLANFLAVVYVVSLRRQARLGLSDLLNSPHSTRASQLVSRLFPLKSLDI
jgi:glycosyltransferase involved in cell wall biosynthesis